MCICTIEVATLFLMLAPVTMIVTKGNEEDSKTISLSNCTHDLSSFSLLQTLKEIRSEKLSITLRPGENSELRGINDGKHLLILLATSTKWPLTRECCQLERESRATASKFE